MTHPPTQAAVAQAATWAPDNTGQWLSWQTPTRSLKPLDEDDKTIDMRSWSPAVPLAAPAAGPTVRP